MEIYVKINGQKVGPLSEEDIRSRINSGEFNDSSLAWQEGLKQWQPLCEFLPLKQAAPEIPASSPRNSNAYLVCITGPDTGKRAEMSDGCQFTIGRSLDCNILSDDPDAFDQHVTVSFNQRQLSFRAAEGAKVFVDGVFQETGVLTGKQQIRVGRSYWQVETPANLKAGAASVFGSMTGKISAVTGVEKFEGLNGKEFFSGVMKKRTDEDVEALFITGTRETTPDLLEIDGRWPKPWLFAKALIASLVVFLGFYYGVYHFGNANFYPGLIMMGSFAIPFAMLIFFVEMNAPRNVSFYQVLKLLFIGGIGSLLISTTFYSLFPSLESFIGGSAAGIVEEAGKVLAVAWLMGGKRYNWTLNGLLFGAAVGAGFAAFESAGYALRIGMEKGDSAMIANIVVRAIFSPGGHTVWTAVACATLWKVKGDAIFQMEMLKNPRFLKVLATVMVMHMLWNAPFGIPFLGDWGLVGKLALLTGFAWMLVLGSVQDGLKQLRRAQEAAKAIVPDILPEILTIPAET